MKKLGRRVAVVGAGKTPFGAFADKDLRTLAVDAGNRALANANTGPGAVQAFYLGNFAGPQFTTQNHLAPYVASELGMIGIPATRFEAACASSGAAFFHAFLAVASGVYDVVMVLGVEKMTSQPTARVTEILAGAGDCSTEVRVGSTFPSLFAMIARRHMHDFGTTREHLSAVAVKNHANGALNPDAQMRKVITLEQAMNARPIAEPLNLYDCSLISDGAAAVILCSADRAAEFSKNPVSVLGSGCRRPISWRSIASPTSQPSPRCGWPRSRRTRWPGSARNRLNSPNCTIASPLRRLSRWRISGSWNGDAVGFSVSKAARNATGLCRSTPAAV